MENPSKMLLKCARFLANKPHSGRRFIVHTFDHAGLRWKIGAHSGYCSWYHGGMILEDIAEAVRKKGYQVQVSGDSLLVYHGEQQIEWLNKVEEYQGGNTVLLESQEEGTQFEVRRNAKRIEMTQLLEVLAERKEDVEESNQDD